MALPSNGVRGTSAARAQPPDLRRDGHGRKGSRFTPDAALVVTPATLTGAVVRTRQTPPSRERRVARFSVPWFHSTSTSKPPRARKPRTVPDGHADGRAGRRSIDAGVTLDEHLDDARDDAEIPIDLERRMCVEEVRVHAAA